jgi:hypothetical protein
LLSGIASKQIALNTLIVIPLRPCPNMIAPMYFGGKIPPRAYVEDWTTPPKIPKTKRIDKHAAKAAPSSLSWFVISGSANMRTEMTSYPPDILKLKEYLCPYTMFPINVNISKPLTANPNTEAGL